MWMGSIVVVGVLIPGALGRSPWSLIQARTAVHGKEGTFSSMDEALTFVQELADRVVGHDVPLTETEKKAVDTIQAYVQRLLEDIKKQRIEDQNEVNRYRQVIQTCADVAKDSLNGAVTNLKSGSDQARKDHATCRQAEVEQHAATQAVCLKYDQYRSTPPGSAPPACMNSLKTSDVSSTDPATKKSMEQCITKINVWVVPLYDLYIKCKAAKDEHLSDTKGCDSKQAKFEGAFCQYATLLLGTCDTQKSCRDKGIKHMEEGDKEVKVAEAARQADCEVGHKVDCLLKIFEETDNKKKPAMLEKCKQEKPTCPEKLNYPPVPGPTKCEKEPSEPCEDSWVEQEYSSQGWYSQAPTTTCHACSSPYPCQVTLFEHANFQGGKSSFPPGEWDTRELRRRGTEDDSVSSLEVEDNCCATVFEHPGFAGKHALFYPGKYDMKDFHERFSNDLVSSLKVEQCTTTTTTTAFPDILKFSVRGTTIHVKFDVGGLSWETHVPKNTDWVTFEKPFPRSGTMTLTILAPTGAALGFKSSTKFSAKLLPGQKNGQSVDFWSKWKCEDPSNAYFMCGYIAKGNLGNAQQDAPQRYEIAFHP